MGGRFTVFQGTGLEVTCRASDKARPEPQEGAPSLFSILSCGSRFSWGGAGKGGAGEPTLYDDKCKTPHKHLLGVWTVGRVSTFLELEITPHLV